MGDLFERLNREAETAAQTQQALERLMHYILERYPEFESKLIDGSLHPRRPDVVITQWLTKDQPKYFTAEHIEQACRTCPPLTVRRYDGLLLVGYRTPIGYLPEPIHNTDRYSIQRFVEENAEQWVIIPETGLTIHWCAHVDNEGVIEAIPTLAELESEQILANRGIVYSTLLYYIAFEALGLQILYLEEDD